MKETRQSPTEQLRSVNREERTVDIIASTFDLDSHGTRIDQSGWDLDAFRKNPVICLQHDDRGYTASNGLPVANAIPETIRIENQKLLMRLRFPAEGTFDLADTVFKLVAEGFLRGVSVGFEPVEHEDTDEEEGGFKKTVRIYKKQRLLEVSLVTIPSNDKALVQRAKTQNADEAVIRRITEHMEELLDKEPVTVDKELGTIKVVVQAEDEAAFEEQVKEIEKHRGYFEKKQPINKLSSGVMEKFYKRILKEEQPAEEAKAWERMGEAIEAIEEKPEQLEEKKEDTTPEVETTPSNPQPVEAPQPAPEAQVSLSLDVLSKLPQAISKASLEAVVKASRQGVPPSEWNGIIDAAGSQILKALSPTSR